MSNRISKRMAVTRGRASSILMMGSCAPSRVSGPVVDLAISGDLSKHR